jgi:hypothetical protein
MRPGLRAPRVNVQGRITVFVKLENGRQVSGKLNTFSVTGGLVQIATCLEERSKVIMTIPIGTGVVRPHAEMMFPMWGANGYLQPFRFTRLWAEERQLLEAEVSELLKQNVTRSTANQGIGFRPRNFYLESF